ncbi:recombinase family protein [Gottfriedia acidiceleris]|uniref:recombinase family protein n=1 Tax=Gottfriedia acidiceleris TaxID=371036 RepID=UPI0013EDA013|nr:recombinase family protein [Gottfriedia acidiceleris]
MKKNDKSVSEILKAAKNIATYTRVSSNDQKFERQIEIITNLMDHRTMDERILFDEKESATKKSFSKREKLNELILAIREGEIDTLVVSDVDRLARDPKEHAELRRIFKTYNVPVILASRNQLYTSDDIVRNALEDGLSKLEVDNLSTRIKASLKEKMSKGSYRGGKVPYGFRFDIEQKKFIEDPDEIEIVKEIFSLYQTSENFNSIARKLNKENKGFISKEKRSLKKQLKWTPNKIKYIITNPIYMGKYAYHRFRNECGYALKEREEWGEAETNDSILVNDPPISTEVWEICWRKYEKLSQNSPKYSNTPFYFRGILKCKCEICNGADFLTKDRRKNKKGKRLYISQCQLKVIDETINEFFYQYWEDLCKKSLKFFEEDVKKIIQLELKKINSELSNNSNMWTEQQNLLKELMKLLDEIVVNEQLPNDEFIGSYDPITIGLMITEDAVRKKIEVLEQNRKKLSNEKLIVENIAGKSSFEYDKLMKILPFNNIDKLSDAQKRSLVLLTVKECYLTPNEDADGQFSFVLNSPFKQYFSL